MGELKDLREQSESLVNRAKELGNKLYLAGLGAYEKAEEGSEELLNKYVENGSKAFGDDAESKPKALLASRGALVAARELLDSAPEKRQALYEKLLEAGKKERGEKAEETNEYLLAGLGAVATAREEGEKLFNERVSTGEKRG